MVVEKLFKKITYPSSEKERNIIVKEYKKKMSAQVNKESAAKDFKMSLLFELVTLLCAAFVFVYGDVSIILKLLYAVPAVAFAAYDFYLLCQVKKENYDNEKHLYKKNISQFFIFVFILYIGTYMLAAASLADEFTTGMGLISWVMFILLSMGSLLKAGKNAPDKFLNMYLNPNKKYHAQPSWALNITRVLVVLICIFKPYMFIMGLTYIVVTPIVYIAALSYYTYLQYDEIEELTK